MNLFQSATIGTRPSSRAVSTPSKSSTNQIACYSNDLQLKYSSILLKPNTSSSSLLKELSNSLKETVSPDELGVCPRFYHVRMRYTSCDQEEMDPDVVEEEEEGEDGGKVKMETKVDEQVREELQLLENNIAKNFRTLQN